MEQIYEKEIKINKYAWDGWAILEYFRNLYECIFTERISNYRI